MIFDFYGFNPYEFSKIDKAPMIDTTIIIKPTALFIIPTPLMLKCFFSFVIIDVILNHQQRAPIPIPPIPAISIGIECSGRTNPNLAYKPIYNRTINILLNVNRKAVMRS